MESLDTFRTVSFAADFASERLPPVTVSGGDFKGRVFRLSLTDGGQPTQAEGVQCRLGWNADPGEALGSFVEAARVDGTATATWEVEVPSSMLAQPRCKAAWMLYTAGTANVLCTLAFDVAVERPVVDTGSAEGEDLADRLWTAIDTMGQATDNANAATESAHRAADAAAEAASKALSQATGNVLASEASGELVNVDDAYPGPLLETKVFGRSEQVTTTGKNLLSNANSVVGKPTATINNAPLTLGAATYTFSFKAAPGSEDIGAGFSLRSASGTLRTIYTSLHSDGLTASATFTVSADEASSMVAYSIAWYSGFLGSTIEAFQLELGSNATAYEPYSGGVPSPSPEWPQPIDSVSSAEVVTAGGNLFGPLRDAGWSQTTNGLTLTHLGGAKFRLTGTATTGYVTFIANKSGNIEDVEGTLPAGTYTMSVFPSDGSSDASIHCGIYGGGVYLADVHCGHSVTFDVAKAAAYSYLRVQTTNGAAGTSFNHTFTVQLEPGSTATDWVPYSGIASRPLDLQGHELRGLPDGTRDELVVNADGSYGIVQRVGHVVLDGTQEHAAVEIDETHCIVVYKVAGAAVVADALKNDNGVRSNVLVGTTQNEAWTNGTEGIYRSSVTGGMVALSLGIGFASTLSAINSWFATNPTDLDYALAAEVYVPLGTLDPAPSWPDVGVNNAWTVSDLATETGVGYVQSVQVVHDKQEARIAALETAIATLEA